jgi:hypothetical protein
MFGVRSTSGAADEERPTLRRGVRPARGREAEQVRVSTGQHLPLRSLRAPWRGSCTGLCGTTPRLVPNRNYEGPARDGSMTCEELTQYDRTHYLLRSRHRCTSRPGGLGGVPALRRAVCGCYRRGRDMDSNQDKRSLGAAIAAVLVLTGTISLLYAPLFL